MSAPVDYDKVAARYDNRYTQNDYSGVKRALEDFLAQRDATGPQPVLEVGCGTGHWLIALGEANIRAVGVDRSEGMLAVARRRVRRGLLVRACAEKLPVANARFGRMFCINALHHFSDRAAFFAEARRVLRPGGGLLTVGLDPHTGRDRWWIYDYFPGTLDADRERYPAAKEIRALMEAAGFSDCETREVQHLARELTTAVAERAGVLERTHTSQFMVIPQAAYEAGLNRIHNGRRAAGETILRSDLRLYGTTGWVGEACNSSTL